MMGGIGTVSSCFLTNVWRFDSRDECNASLQLLYFDKHNQVFVSDTMLLCYYVTMLIQIMGGIGTVSSFFLINVWPFEGLILSRDH